MAPKRKHPGAVALGKLSGKARMVKITPEQRADIARNAARARWAAASKPLDRVPAARKRRALCLNDKEIAGALGVSLERLVAVLDEAGLHLSPKKAASAKAQQKGA